jgi:uracil-DNA glycosylase
MSRKILQRINDQVVSCSSCPRLAEYIRQVGQEKVKRHASEKYWARPLPSFGDPKAKLLIIGLAPAAHGGNRTGRMFTGDSSGDWVARALYESGFASIPTSRSINDGLVLHQAYITAAVRCAPPDNKPLQSELAKCSKYLAAELQLFCDIPVVLTLGKIAFDSFCRLAKIKGFKFAHGAQYSIPSGKKGIRTTSTLIASYHPSRQNTNTGRLTWPMWKSVFIAARRLADSDIEEYGG